MLTKKLLFPAVLAVAATFATGCQTTPVEAPGPDPIAEVRAIAEEALRTANSAAYDAATAKDLAISAADTTAAAQACCDANSRRMDRMFKGSMGAK